MDDLIAGSEGGKLATVWPSWAYPRRRWGLKERLLAPIVLLMLLAASLPIVVGNTLAQQQADIMIRSMVCWRCR